MFRLLLVDREGHVISRMTGEELLSSGAVGSLVHPLQPITLRIYGSCHSKAEVVGLGVLRIGKTESRTDVLWKAEERATAHDT